LNDSKANANNATLPTTNADIPIPRNVDLPIPENLKPKFQKIDTSLLEWGPGLRQQIWDYHVNQYDEIRRVYINYDVFQPDLTTYKKSGPKHHRRSFQKSWIFMKKF
jgi:hypothetical protein